MLGEGLIGFIGRHVALHLHENQLASEVRLVDKVLPQLAWLAPEFEEACSKEKFVQADASRERKWRIPEYLEFCLGKKKRKRQEKKKKKKKHRENHLLITMLTMRI